MRTFLLSLLLFLAWALFSTWYYCCQIRCLCNKKAVVAPVMIEEKLKNLALREGNNNILQGYDQFSFNNNANAPTLSANNNEFLDKAAAYLKANPDRKLTITGRYLKSEAHIKPGFYENLGLARAAAIRDILVKMGISEDRISLDYAMIDDSKLREPLAFDILTSPTENKAQFSFRDMTFSDVNFDFNSAVFKPGEQFVVYADSLKSYLTHNPKTDITIVGHTDDVGSEDYNRKLGLARARSVVDYLRKKGIKNKMAIDSKGELEPIVPNDSEENRLKNRRVNLKF